MSNETIKGTVEAVKDDGGSKGKFGFQHKLGIKIDGDWYGGWTKKSAEDLGIEEGRTVSFEFTENGQYKNFVEKTIKVSKSTESAPAAAGKPTAAKADYTAGVKVGHAINNAVLLAIAAKTTDMESIGKIAVDVLKLSARLESAYPAIADAANKAAAAKTKAAAPPAEEEQEEEQEEAPAPPPKKTAAKSKAPAKAAPPPADDAGFDDDIPF